MKKPLVRKLVLRHETLRNLSTTELAQVAGGALWTCLNCTSFTDDTLPVLKPWPTGPKPC